MTEVVEVYRGVTVVRTRPQAGTASALGFEAVVEDWRLMSATLPGLRAQIDEHLDRNGPGSGIFRRDQLQP